MSLTYKDKSEIEYGVEIQKLLGGKINMVFSCDGGKFGTDEILDEFEIPVKQLLDILQHNLREMKEQ